MLQIIRNFFFSKNPNIYWFQTLVLLGIAMLLVLLYKRQNLSPFYEGFSQDAPFVSKYDQDIYDDFYVQIYDRLFLSDKMGTYIADKVIEMTQPTPEKSVFLDIGSGTGNVVSHLHDRGYRAYGIDTSKAMVKHSSDKFPDIHIKCGDVMEPMIFEPNTMTHILCTEMTLYQFTNKNKRTFFKNCHHWLMPGGYLAIQLVDPDTFDTIIPGGKPPLITSPQQYVSKRITDTIIDFIDFEYKASYQMDPTSNKESILKETFTDGLTKNVRQNEITLFMEDIDTIVATAKSQGFLLQGLVNLQDGVIGDKHQYLYVFKRYANVIGYKPV